jgi:hypothetical protein
VRTGSRLGGYTDTQTVLPSGQEGYQGLAALEMLYHEATHIDVADTITDQLAAELKATHRSPDLALWHAVLFYTVGETVKAVLKRQGGLDCETYADKNGLTPVAIGKPSAPPLIVPGAPNCRGISRCYKRSRGWCRNCRRPEARFDANLFWTQVRDYEATLAEPSANGGSILQILSNVGKGAHAWGETELAAMPAEGLNLRLVSWSSCGFAFSP